MGFWKKLKKPIIALAPMADVTDAAFRRMFARYGKPDVFWTEFVSVEALDSEGRENALIDFWHSKDERPIVAQIFGSKPEQFEKAAHLIKELGFDGIDINAGCPDKSVCKQGAGAALIEDPKRTKEIIEATKEGGLPVSIKTRIGWNKDITEEWVEELLNMDPVAITLHARTKKEMSDVPANWEAIRRAAEARDKSKKNILILGNGDVTSLKDAHKKIEDTGCDGVMVGRGIFGNPWFFAGKERKEVEIPTRLRVMSEHAALFEELFQKKKNFSIMKKHFKAYVSDFDGSKELRIKLMETESAKEVEEIVEDFLKMW